jgi:hypothetical protein
LALLSIDISPVTIPSGNINNNDNNINNNNNTNTPDLTARADEAYLVELANT